MSQDFSIKQGDTRPYLRAALETLEGEPVDLTSATVTFRMCPKNATESVIESAAQIITANEGIVEYQWQSGDTDTPGLYDIEFKVTFSGGAVESFPNQGYDSVVIAKRLPSPTP